MGIGSLILSIRKVLEPIFDIVSFNIQLFFHDYDGMIMISKINMINISETTFFNYGIYLIRKTKISK